MAYEQPKTGLGSVEETNRLLQESSKQTGLVAPAFSSTGAITSETLSSSQTPVFVPTPTPSTSAEGLSGIATSYGEQQKALNESLKADADKKEAALSESKTGLLDTMNEYLGIVTGRGQAEKDAGLDVKAQKVTDYTNQLEASQRAQTNELRALQGAALTDVQRAAQSREINRKYAFEQADLALLQSAANRDYETAFNIVNRKIELQLEPLKLKLDFQKMFYEENKDLFNKAEQREFDALIKATDREYETEKATKTAIANIQLEALKSGITIPQSVLSQLNTARDVQEAIAILARNGISLQDPLERRIQEAQLANLYSQIEERNSAPEGVRTITGKPQTASQSSANGYADRLAEADVVIGAVGSKFTGKFSIGGSLPNALQSGDRQAYEQAKRNFVNAVLRRESGAAISPTEFTSAEKQYFPQAGDQPQVVKQKEASRNTAINNLYREANVARPVLPGQIIESNGKRYRVGSDGETLEEI